MNIGIVIGRIGGIDGVALETEKWINVLQRMGHTCFILTGELEGKISNTTILSELSFFHQWCIEEQEMAYFKQHVKEETVKREIESHSLYIAKNIKQWIIDNNIDLLISENSSTIPCHLSMGIALEIVFRETGIRGIIHNHDFYWERGGRYKSHYKYVNDQMIRCFPPILPNIQHVVINSYNQSVLIRERDTKSTIIPNVMDFRKPFAIKDKYNSSMLSDLGLNEDNIPIFQVTRIVRRKGIETAIKLIHLLSDTRYKLIITGNAKDDEKHEYFNELKTLIMNLEINEQIIFAEDKFNNYRHTNGNGVKIYSLEDAYAYARAMTYFSSYEGFGNAFVEAVLAKVPVFVNNYKPVYWADIGSKGFKTVQIEDNLLTDNAIMEMKKVLEDDSLISEITDYNFQLGKRYFSYEVLEELLRTLL